MSIRSTRRALDKYIKTVFCELSSQFLFPDLRKVSFLFRFYFDLIRHICGQLEISKSKEAQKQKCKKCGAMWNMSRYPKPHKFASCDGDGMAPWHEVRNFDGNLGKLI